jgi:hypothetical protein
MLRIISLSPEKKSANKSPTGQGEEEWVTSQEQREQEVQADEPLHHRIVRKKNVKCRIVKLHLGASHKKGIR